MNWAVGRNGGLKQALKTQNGRLVGQNRWLVLITVIGWSKQAAGGPKQVTGGPKRGFKPVVAVFMLLLGGDGDALSSFATIMLVMSHL